MLYSRDYFVYLETLAIAKTFIEVWTQSISVSMVQSEQKEIESHKADEKIRKYNADGQLLAYRSENKEKHLVVSKGKDPATRWEKLIPAKVKRPIPNQKRWTIPDNWDQRIYYKRNSIAYGFYHVPEVDVWAKVSIPTNNWLIDAWYGVESVGKLNFEPVGNLASKKEIRELADKYEEKYSRENVEKNAELIREIADNWDLVEKELEMATEFVLKEGVQEKLSDRSRIRADEKGQIEFNYRVFRPEDILSDVIDLSKYDMPLSIAFDEIRGEDLIPDHYAFRPRIDSSDIDMEYYLKGLIESGLNPAKAIDYYMVEQKEISQTKWASMRNIDQSTVSNNVKKATRKLKSAHQ